MTDPERFRTKLGEQLGFLRASCRLYDEGTEAEAFRLATTLRLLFHNTRSSTSLMKHLGIEAAPMLATPRAHGDWRDYLSVQIAPASPKPVVLKPLLRNLFTPVCSEEWWDKQSIFSHEGSPYSRRAIILGAANRDGGAHVDTRLDPFYLMLRSGKGFPSITGNLTFNGAPPYEQGTAIHPENGHLALIRQFAHETLSTATHYRWSA